MQVVCQTGCQPQQEESVGQFEWSGGTTNLRTSQGKQVGMSISSCPFLTCNCEKMKQQLDLNSIGSFFPSHTHCQPHRLVCCCVVVVLPLVFSLSFHHGSGI